MTAFNGALSLSVCVVFGKSLSTINNPETNLT